MHSVREKKTNATHFSVVFWFTYVQCEVHSTSSSKNFYVRSTLVHKKLEKNKLKPYSGVTVRCSAIFSLKRCILLSDAVHASILVSRKIECHFDKMKTVLKPQGIRESVLHEKVAHRRYLSNAVSFESFQSAVEKNRKIRSLPLVGNHIVFKIHLQPSGISINNQHMKIAPIPQLSNATSHTSLRRIVKKLHRKSYEKSFLKTKFRISVNLKLLLNHKNYRV